MDKESFYNWLPPEEFVEWAKYSLHITISNQCMADDDIRLVIRWIGENSWDTVYFENGRTRWGRIGLSNMLLVTLLVFPHYYAKYELSQFN